MVPGVVGITLIVAVAVPPVRIGDKEHRKYCEEISPVKNCAELTLQPPFGVDCVGGDASVAPSGKRPETRTPW